MPTTPDQPPQAIQPTGPSRPSRSTSAEPLRIERDAAILRITLDRADKHNPLSLEVLRLLRAALASVREDPTLACVLIRGAGQHYFAAGGDLDELDAVRTEASARAWATEAREALDAVRDFPLPTVAVLNGDAIGGGAELAIACDFRIAREGAHIGYIHGRLAITSAWGGGTDLVELVGPSRALRMMARHELVPVALGHLWGLVDSVAPISGLDDAVDAFIAPLLSQPAQILRALKGFAVAARRGASRDALRAEEAANLLASWMRPEHWAAVAQVRRGGGG
jgi:enoyl-CoA hydratase